MKYYDVLRSLEDSFIFFWIVSVMIWYFSDGHVLKLALIGLVLATVTTLRRLNEIDFTEKIMRLKQ